jgi:hypothetical protein
MASGDREYLQTLLALLNLQQTRKILASQKFYIFLC